MKYQGSCHCKAVQFEIQTSEIIEALQCNCSVCIRKNAIMSKKSFGKEEFSLISGKEQLSVYRWGDHDVNHYFCNVCGIYPFHDTSYDPEVFRVNLGCLDAIEPRELDITQFNGRDEL